MSELYNPPKCFKAGLFRFQFGDGCVVEWIEGNTTCQLEKIRNASFLRLSSEDAESKRGEKVDLFEFVGRGKESFERLVQVAWASGLTGLHASDTRFWSLCETV